MKSHRLLGIGLAFWLAQILSTSQASGSSTGNIFSRQEGESTGQVVDKTCGFVGNADFYGVGVRVGFYCQWASNLIAWIFKPSLCEELADEQTIFLAANLIAAVVLSVTNAENTNVVVIILLFYMFFGGSISAVTSAAASLDGWEGSRGFKKIGMLFRQMFVQATFLAMLGFSIWFWSTGLYNFQRLECDTYVFPIGHRLSLDSSEPGAAIALVLLIAVYLMTWWVAVRRMGKRFENVLPEKMATRVERHKSHLPKVLRIIPQFEERHWRYLGTILTTLTILWSIAGLELTLVNNHVTGVNYLGTTGQLIPFIIGATSLPTVIWAVIESYHDERTQGRGLGRVRERGARNYEELTELYNPQSHILSPPLERNTAYHSPHHHQQEELRDGNGDMGVKNGGDRESKRFSDMDTDADTASLFRTQTREQAPALASPLDGERYEARRRVG